MGTQKDSERTRAKIIEAAGQLFAERGFNGVTVRDIVQKADTHLGALNYHFRTKDTLYREVLLEACREASFSPEDQRQLLKLDPRKALSLLVRESLETYRQQTASNWQNVIITRECWEPSAVFGDVVEEYLKPQTDFIARTIGKIVDRPFDSPSVQFAVLTLIGLLETFGLYDHYVDAVAPGLSDYGHNNNWFVKQIEHLVIEAASSRHEE